MEPSENNEEKSIEQEPPKNVKFHPDDTFTSDDGGDQPINEDHTKEAKLKATPAIFKRRQATKHLVVQSPTDHIFSPISQRLLQKKRTEVIRPIDLNDED